MVAFHATRAPAIDSSEPSVNGSMRLTTQQHRNCIIQRDDWTGPARLDSVEALLSGLLLVSFGKSKWMTMVSSRQFHQITAQYFLTAAVWHTVDSKELICAQWNTGVLTLQGSASSKISSRLWLEPTSVSQSYRGTAFVYSVRTNNMWENGVDCSAKKYLWVRGGSFRK